MTPDEMQAARDPSTRWRPRTPGTMLVAPLESYGDRGGLYVHEDAGRNRMLGYVLVTNACRDVKPDDVVLFEEGSDEPLVTSAGDRFSWLREASVIDVDPNFWPKAQAV